MSWWLKNNLRLIQNNLRDVDVLMDVDQHIEHLKQLKCNVLMVGCGGITAFYPTRLEYHYRNPYMKHDFLGEIVEKCHQNGIRVIARFDFSKTYAGYFDQKPEWYSKSIHGHEIRYNDTVATCVNGEYQQEYSLKIIREVLENYPVDGIFFNMFGYQTRDYSNNYVGICQCENCKRRFMEMFGEQLPTVEDENDPVFKKYKQFKKNTVIGVLDKIHALVKGINEDVAICTYHYHKIDMIRDESNSAVDRPYPFWLYASSQNVSSVMGTYEDKISSNCVINAVDIFYRFMGVSKYLNQIRLYEEIASGSGLDFCIIGAFEGYPDTDNFEMTKEVFCFHHRYEQYFGHFESLARIMLVKPEREQKDLREYLGIFKLLKEEHRLFRVVEQENLDAHANRLDQYDFILIPGIPELKSGAFSEALSRTTASVIATGSAMNMEPAAIKEIFGVRLNGKLKPVRSSYLFTQPKTVFTSFRKRDWVYLDGDYHFMECDDCNNNLLNLVSTAMFGPPERCFGHNVSEQPSVTLHPCKQGQNMNAYFPWQPGTLYYQHGYEDFKYLLLNVMDHINPHSGVLTTNAPKNVELFFDRCGKNQYILQLLNLSGFNGTTVYEPTPVHNITVALDLPTPQRVFELGRTELVPMPGKAEIDIARLDNYKAYIIEL